MKKILMIALFASGLAFGQTKKMISSDLHWWGYKIAKTKSSSHEGTINVQSGSLVLKNGDIVGGDFLLDMSTINATDLSGERQEKLNKHLKDGDFFEVEKFPNASYKITSVKKNGNKDFNMIVMGNLTVKGKTLPVSFPAKISNENGTISLESDKFSFDRQKFDINYKSPLEDAFIKDEVEMKVKIMVQ